MPVLRGGLLPGMIPGLRDDIAVHWRKKDPVIGLEIESMDIETGPFRTSEYPMETPSATSPGDHSGPSPEAEPIIKQFVEHWGLMARTWGINSSMGELFALLYITGTDWTADDLRHRLGISRANVSMNLRELLSWGVVHKVHRAGERRELFRAETDVWTLFRKILAERKRRELDPSLRVLDQSLNLAKVHPDLHDLMGRIEQLRRFFRSIDTLAVQLLSLPIEDMAEISHLVLGEAGGEAQEAQE
jgi:HTH-type transcriptional regulator, glycine betaine synthesis regulator